MVKDEYRDLLADSHNILRIWNNYLYQLLDVHGVNDVRQTEMHTDKIEIATEKLKRYIFLGTDQIPAELNKAGGNILSSEVHKLIKPIWNKEELSQQWKESIVVTISTKSDKSDCSNYWGISVLPNTNKMLFNILVSRLTPYVDEIIGDHQSEFLRNRSTSDLIFCIGQILEKK
jgi:hypothetical protein